MFQFLGKPLNLEVVSMLVFHKQASKIVLVLAVKCFQCLDLLYALSLFFKMTTPTVAQP